MPRSNTSLWRDPRLPQVESRRACNSRACYKAHSHPTFSIGAVDAGSSLFTGAGCGSERLTPGTLVAVPAHRVHACNPEADQPWSYQMLHVDAGWLAELRTESGLPSGAPEQPARVSRDAEAYSRFCQLNAVLFSEADPMQKEAELIAFLCDIDFETFSPLAPAPVLQASALQGLLTKLRDQDPAGLTVKSLAREAGLGRYQLIRAFRAATGLTPHAYLLNARINQGRQLLRQGQRLVQVAHDLGFADQSHFQRVFKAHVGITPGHYLKVQNMK
ncbi:AraC family transcriptional regulator [Pseudomonas putida]|uniref:AraC family transcriptional regulator n=1 Tax=Pseudomonas putida TaxID=303 RepID=UPI0035709EF7